MMLLPPNGMENVLFETELIEQPASQGGQAHRSGLKLGNRITCGLPVGFDLMDYFKKTKEAAPFELQSQTDKYSFHLVRLVCSFHPASASEIRWAEFGLSLSLFDEQIPSGAVVIGRITPAATVPSNPDDHPIIYDLYPKEVVDKEQVSHTVELSPKFKFKGVGVDLGKDAVTIAYERLTPRIKAFGEREREAYWRFEPGTGDKVEEGIKEMDVVVRKKKGTVVLATIRIKGEGRRWGIFRAAQDPTAQQFYF